MPANRTQAELFAEAVAVLAMPPGLYTPGTTTAPQPLGTEAYCTECDTAVLWRLDGLIPHADPVQDGQGGHPVALAWRTTGTVTP